MSDLPFTKDELERYRANEQIANFRLKGSKPTPEQRQMLADRKVADKELFAAIRVRAVQKVEELEACGGEAADAAAAAADPKLLQGYKTLAAKADKGLKKALEKALANHIAVERAAFLLPPMGTRDFFPADMRFRNYLFGKFREAGLAFGFEEYDAPVLEHQRLYKRKAGEEIVEQMYAFTEKDGYEVTLRPEMTPSLARMVLQRQNAQSGEIKEVLPLKWFCVAQCWRHEATQRGRKREHYQWNMDIVGLDDITAELELLAAIVAFFRSVGITAEDIGIKVNSRRVLNSICSSYGVPDAKFAPVCVILDKLDKIGDAAVKELLVAAPLHIPEASVDKMLASLKATSVEAIVALMGEDATQEMRDACDEMQRLFDYAAAYGFSDFLQFDASVVRGLAYYTGIVFEGFDKKFDLRAICGGGRYDRLMELYGSPVKVPCVGFGFGDCVIKELLEELGKMPSTAPSVDFVVAAFNEDMFAPSLQVATRLREAGQSVNMLLTVKKGRKAFDFANKVGAQYVAYVAPDEWAAGKVRVKDMQGTEKGEDGLGFDVALEDIHTRFSKTEVLPGGGGGGGGGGCAAAAVAAAAANN